MTAQERARLLNCKHHRQELCRRVIRGGSIQLWIQCPDCGHRLNGSAIPHRESPVPVDELPAYDEKAEEKYWRITSPQPDVYWPGTYGGAGE